MGEAFSGTAVSPTENGCKETHYLICIGLILTLAVGSLTVATNAFEDERNLTEDVGLSVSDNALSTAVAVPSTRSDEKHEVSGFAPAESECGCWGPFDTEQGWIDYAEYNIPDELALCIDDNYLAEWYVDVWVYGGYNPWQTGGYIEVYQKGALVGMINIAWTWVEKGECCAYDKWHATFYVDDPFCLESNQYPDVAPWCIDWPEGQETIPGKEVYMRIVTYWTGCTPGEEPSQDFTIICNLMETHQNDASLSLHSI
ncbi:hypothetical protein EU545_02675 [Candidatus Thorarchaeota archaeon]|jgi:hypothetical protein|nr:MAG: hypothetical protein EU545_02675 [Candidatus Thorarchaeota archaeon]